ncbi:hypothetical protein [Sphingobacterium psychroaquaticum]|uniref:Uncharacterized protein n=1 Tax=Sphingobacterium psychroaquaticum TaxID=561061 RepID=A0A1X7JV82_9SPHI|nr:hypothetical protein [Sphingobacterium psychroaquaticum]SMG32249.1 hypothetical protein SAMN05660862_2240 [Sphingobacterium psychroaquaticum]
MNIGLQITTDMNALMKEVEKEIEKETIKHLSAVLERSVELVRNKISEGGDAYQDHTGNLRSSTGFIITKDGKVVHKSFKESPVGTDKQTGLSEGLKSALSELRPSQGYAVVLVSGMEYASWVQSKGFDVLRGAYMGLDQILQQAFNEIGTIE